MTKFRSDILQNDQNLKPTKTPKYKLSIVSVKTYDKHGYDVYFYKFDHYNGNVSGGTQGLTNMATPVGLTLKDPV